jgi:hypothetical protein
MYKDYQNKNIFFVLMINTYRFKPIHLADIF